MVFLQMLSLKTAGEATYSDHAALSWQQKWKVMGVWRYVGDCLFHPCIIDQSTPNCFMPQTCERQERRTHGVDGVDKFAGFAELHEAFPEVVQWSLHQNLLLLVVVQQVIPQRLFRQRFWVPNNNYTVPVGQQRNQNELWLKIKPSYPLASEQPLSQSLSQ